MAECVAAPQWALGAARRWLRGPAAAQALGALARRAAQHHDARARSLLLLCLSSDAHGGTARPRGEGRDSRAA